MGEMRGSGRPSAGLGCGLGGEPCLFFVQRANGSLRILDGLAAAVAIALQFLQPFRQFMRARPGAPLLGIDLLARELQTLEGGGAARLLLPERLNTMFSHRIGPGRFALQPCPLGNGAGIDLELAFRRLKLGAGIQHGQMQQQRFGLADMAGDLTVADRLSGLAAQALRLRFKMLEHILDTDEVVFRGPQTQFGLVPARIKPCNAGGVFQDPPTRLRFGGNDFADLALPDHGRRAGAGGGIRKEQLHVAGAGLAGIDTVG